MCEMPEPFSVAAGQVSLISLFLLPVARSSALASGRHLQRPFPPHSSHCISCNCSVHCACRACTKGSGGRPRRAVSSGTLFARQHGGLSPKPGARRSLPRAWYMEASDI